MYYKFRILKDKINVLLLNLLLIIRDTLNIIVINLFLNPYLFYIFISIIYFILFLSFSDITLCDELPLEDLKSVLEKEINVYRDSLNKYDQDVNLFEEGLVRPERHEDMSSFLRKRVSYSAIKIIKDLRKVRQTEELISKLDSKFKSDIPTTF